MKKLLVFSIIFILFSANFSILKADEGASIYLSPSGGTVHIGNTFNVSVFVNTGGHDINAVEVNLKFDSTKLQVVSPTAGLSFISVWVSQPSYSNKKGTISFRGGIPAPGINTSSGLISTIVFRTIAPGNAIISVEDSSKVLLNDGEGTNVLSLTGQGVYEIILPPARGPVISSSTHPDQSRWYKNSSPVLELEKAQGVTDFSYTIDKDFQGTPDNVSEGGANSISYSDLKDGIWYFHVKAKRGDHWGGIGHYIIKIDTLPPAIFDLSMERNLASMVSLQDLIVSFVTTDNHSGVDHYRLKTINIARDSENEEVSSFVEVDSPYRLSFDEVGDHKIVVRAFDKAGNWRDSIDNLYIIQEGKLMVTKEGINFWFVFIRWWLLVLILILLIGTVLLVMFLAQKYHIRIYKEKGKIMDKLKK